MAQGKSAKVAFIGTGIMGAPIAGHIMDAGYDVTVYNRTKSKADGLVERGAHWADDVASAVEGADVVFTMLGYPTDVEDVYLSTNGILRSSKKGAFLIDLTTSSPDLARDIHGAAEVDDRHAFDCPVTGGEEGAKAGTLTLFVGATPKEAEPVLPLLQCFSSKITYFDQAGAGQTVKLCNQVSLASCMMGYAEAMALAEASGVDVARMLQAVSSGMGGSVALSRLAPKSLEGDYRPGFLSEHLLKDVTLSLDAADELGIGMPSTATAENLYKLLCQVGGARLGTQAISLLYAPAEVGEKAGLDWSKAKVEDEDGDGCCGGHGDGCCGGHGDGEGHECHCHHHNGGDE